MDDNDDHQLRLQGLRRMLERKRIIRQNILGATGDVVDNLGDRDDDEGNFDSMHYLEYYQSLGRDPPPGFNWENQAMTPVLDAEELDLDEYQILVYHHDRYLATGIRNVNRDQTDEADEWRIMQESKGRALGHYHNWQGGHDVEMEVLENDNGDVDFGNDEAGEVLEEEEVVEEEELVEEEVVMETAGGVLTHNYGVGGESPADIQIALSVSDAAKTDTDPLVESLVSNTAAALTPHPNTPAERDLSAKSPVDKEPEPVARQLFAKVVSIGKVTGDIVSTYKLLYEVLPHDSISHFFTYIVLYFRQLWILVQVQKRILMQVQKRICQIINVTVLIIVRIVKLNTKHHFLLGKSPRMQG